MKIYLEEEWVYPWQLVQLNIFMVGHGGSSVSSYLANLAMASTVL